ncbi:hypothetical protein GCM10010965_26500 [Caldalkalibacillus thermarum]|nr:hypothetical protein GCM10010965_26500 [Caldalkalibacillus thermarum]
MVMNFLDRYIISTNLLLLLVMLSPIPTNFYDSNVIPYIFVTFVISVSTFFIEYLFNKAGYERKEKAKKMYLFVMPMNMIIYVVFLLFVFD